MSPTWKVMGLAGEILWLLRLDILHSTEHNSLSVCSELEVLNLVVACVNETGCKTHCCQCVVRVYGVSKPYGCLVGTFLGGVEVAVINVECRMCHECIRVPDVDIACLEVT